MTEKNNERIEEFLRKNGADITEMTKKQLSNMEKADAEIQRRLHEIEKAEATISANEIGITAIAKATGISNKTFYNNKLLNGFVEYFKRKTNNDELVEENSNLKNRLKEEREKINKFLIRDIETEELRHTVQELRRELMSLEKRNQELLNERGKTEQQKKS